MPDYFRDPLFSRSGRLPACDGRTDGPNAHDTRSRNWRQKTGVGFWRRFFTQVAKFLVPETNIATVLLVG